LRADALPLLTSFIRSLRSASVSSTMYFLTMFSLHPHLPMERVYPSISSC
jgi:hypothetical protein